MVSAENYDTEIASTATVSCLGAKWRPPFLSLVFGLLTILLGFFGDLPCRQLDGMNLTRVFDASGCAVDRKP
jgi:hypothetical protein